MNFHHMPSTMLQTRTTRFGSGGAAVRSRDPLTDEQIARVAPSVFALDKHDSRSDVYTYIPTAQVLAGLRREGFEPFAVKQGGSRDVEKRGFTKHMIRLRHAGAAAPRQVGDSVAELVLINSHDGTSAYHLMFGWFRLICTNGLIVADKDRGAMGIRVPHKGDVVGDVIDGAYRVISEGASQGAAIEQMQNVLLAPPEANAFAHAAAELRWEGAPPIAPELLVAPRRVADAGNDLWRTFNRVQENVIRGGIDYVQRDDSGRRVARRQTRPVNGVDQDVKLNRALWVLAEEMAKLKAA